MEDLKDLTPAKEQSQWFEDPLVFISGTWDDMKNFRDTVARAIVQAHYRPCDPHRMPGFHERVLASIDRELGERSAAYVGVFGLRYGSLTRDPEGLEVSYSEYEYRKARERWANESPPPILIYLPKPGSSVYKEIWEAGRKAAHDQYVGDEIKVDLDFENQEEFLEVVKGSLGDLADANRILDGEFSDREDLLKQVGYTLSRWHLELLASEVVELRHKVALLEGPPSRQADKDPLPGSLEQAIPRVDKSLALFEQRSAEKKLPGLCLCVHGRDANRLVDVLRRQNHWDVEDPDCWRDMATERGDKLFEIWRTAWEATNDAPSREDPQSYKDPAEVAKAIIASERPVLLTFANMNRLGGKLETFLQEFWYPLYDHLARSIARGAGGKGRRRLLVLLGFEGPAPVTGDRLDVDTPALRVEQTFRKALYLRIYHEAPEKTR